jgi:hypothetical protein
MDKAINRRQNFGVIHTSVLPVWTLKFTFL